MPASARIGTVLSSRKIANPPAALVVDRNSMIFNAAESGEHPVSQMVSVRNAGACGTNDCLYMVRNARPGVAYSFALRAVDWKNREGIPALWSTR